MASKGKPLVGDAGKHHGQSRKRERVKVLHQAIAIEQAVVAALSSRHNYHYDQGYRAALDNAVSTADLRYDGDDSADDAQDDPDEAGARGGATHTASWGLAGTVSIKNLALLVHRHRWDG